MSEHKYDIQLSIDGVSHEDFLDAWARLSNIAQGFALDGLARVEVNAWRVDEDGDGDSVIHPIVGLGEPVSFGD